LNENLFGEVAKFLDVFDLNKLRLLSPTSKNKIDKFQNIYLEKMRSEFKLRRELEDKINSFFHFYLTCKNVISRLELSTYRQKLPKAIECLLVEQLIERVDPLSAEEIEHRHITTIHNYVPKTKTTTSDKTIQDQVLIPLEENIGHKSEMVRENYNSFLGMENILILDQRDYKTIEDKLKFPEEFKTFVSENLIPIMLGYICANPSIRHRHSPYIYYLWRTKEGSAEDFPVICIPSNGGLKFEFESMNATFFFNSIGKNPIKKAWLEGHGISYHTFKDLKKIDDISKLNLEFPTF